MQATPIFLTHTHTHTHRSTYSHANTHKALLVLQPFFHRLVTHTHTHTHNQTPMTCQVGKSLAGLAGTGAVLTDWTGLGKAELFIGAEIWVCLGHDYYLLG